MVSATSLALARAAIVAADERFAAFTSAREVVTWANTVPDNVLWLPARHADRAYAKFAEQRRGNTCLHQLDRAAETECHGYLDRVMIQGRTEQTIAAEDLLAGRKKFNASTLQHLVRNAVIAGHARDALDSTDLENTAAARLELEELQAGFRNARRLAVAAAAIPDSTREEIIHLLAMLPKVPADALETISVLDALVH